MSKTETLNALLFDTRSIQKYIFSSNRMSTNIGASFIVDKLFTEILIGKVLKDFFPEENFLANDSGWNIDKDNLETWHEMKKCSVAYVGGGNALILFKSDSDDVDCQKIFSPTFGRKTRVENRSRSRQADYHGRKIKSG